MTKQAQQKAKQRRQTQLQAEKTERGQYRQVLETKSSILSSFRVTVRPTNPYRHEVIDGIVC